MENNESITLRQMLVDAMSGHHSHVDFDSAVEDLPAELRGIKPAGVPHTAWQLLEHMRIAQWDILEFSCNPSHKSPKWPDEYWPKTDAPPTHDAWEESLAAFRRDAQELARLVQDAQHDLFKPFENGKGQTVLREALVVANHNSYHLGQLVFLKKMLLSRR